MQLRSREAGRPLQTKKITLSCLCRSLLKQYVPDGVAPRPRNHANNVTQIVIISFTRSRHVDTTCNRLLGPPLKRCTLKMRRAMFIFISLWRPWRPRDSARIFFSSLALSFSAAPAAANPLVILCSWAPRTENAWWIAAAAATWFVLITACLNL
jgi:hypothetical protein